MGVLLLLAVLGAGGQAFEPPPLAVYLERASVLPGESVAVHARSAVGPPRLTLAAWRGGETVLDAGAIEASAEPFSKDDVVRGCGWATAARLTVPPDTPSGVYAVRLEGGGETAQAPLVVRAASPGARSRILLL